jgi:MFS family permease
MRRMITLVSAMVLLDLATFSAIVPLLPELSGTLDLSKSEAGIVVAAYSAAIVGLSVPAGHLADRIGARRMSIAGTLLMAAATAGLAVADSFGLLLASRFGQGAASCIVWSAGLAWLAARAPEEERGRAISWANACATAGMIAGPLLGGAVTEAFGVRATFMGVAVVCLALAAWAAFEPGAAPGGHRESGMRPALRAAAGDRLIGISLLVILLVSIVGGALQVLLSLQLDDLGATRSAIGLYFSLAAVLGAVAIVLSARAGDRVGRVRLAGWTSAALAAATALLLLPLPLGGFAALLILIGPLQSILYGVGYPLGADGADRAHLGHGLVLGVINLAWGIGAIVGPAAGANLADAAGDRASYAALTIACLVSAAYILRSDRSLREAGRPAAARLSGSSAGR